MGVQLKSRTITLGPTIDRIEHFIINHYKPSSGIYRRKPSKASAKSHLTGNKGQREKGIDFLDYSDEK